MNWLLAQQVRSKDSRTDGRIGPAEGEQWIYGHAIATLAMVEFYLHTASMEGLENSVTDAAKLCLRAQNRGFGWRYGIQPGDNDSSIAAWMVMTLHAAKKARLAIENDEFDRAFQGSLKWYDRATSPEGTSPG